MHHFKTELWHFSSLHCSGCWERPHCVRVAAAADSEMNYIPTAHCVWADQTVVYTDSMVLSVQF